MKELDKKCGKIASNIRENLQILQDLSDKELVSKISVLDTMCARLRSEMQGPWASWCLFNDVADFIEFLYKFEHKKPKGGVYV